MGMRISHISTIVRNLDVGIARYKAVFGVDPRLSGAVPNEGVKYAKIPVGGIDMELIEPTADNAVSKHLDWRGEGIHHIGFVVDDLDREIEGLEARGVELAAPYKNTVGFTAPDYVSRYAMIRPRFANGVLIAYTQRDPV